MMGFKIKSPTIEKIIKLKKILRAFFLSPYFLEEDNKTKGNPKDSPIAKTCYKNHDLVQDGEWIASKNFKN